MLKTYIVFTFCTGLKNSFKNIYHKNTKNMCLLVRVSTDLTDMRLNVGVNLHVVGQRTFVREALVTFTALERSLACNRNELKLASEIK